MPHHADVGVDRAIEGQVLRQRVHEHQRVVDVRAHDRLLGARLREAQPALRRRRQLAREDGLRKEAAEHGGAGERPGDGRRQRAPATSRAQE
jgi:hypothetical protein